MMSTDERIAAIENRISALEKILQPKPVAAPIVNPKPPTVQNKPVVAEEKPGNWLGIVATICFVFAAAFIIKLAIDSGWLTPSRQIGLAIVLACSLIAAGLYLLDLDRAYASFLPGAGVVILYLSVFAAFRFYGLISFDFSIFGITLVSMISLWLYSRIQHDIYPIIAAFGSYTAPAIFQMGANSDFALIYYVFCSLTFSFLSIWVESRTLAIVASYLAIGMTSLLGISLNDPKTISILLAIHFGIFSVGTYFYSTRKGSLRESESWSYFPILLFFYATEYFFLHGLVPELAPWISIAFSAVLLGLYFLAKSTLNARYLESTSMLVSFSAIVFLHSFYLEILPDLYKPALFLVIVFGAALFNPKSKNIIVQLVAGWILLMEYLSMASFVLNNFSWVWLFWCFLSSISLIFLFAMRRDELRNKEFGLIILGAAHGLAILSFYRLFYESGSLAVSLAWLLYSLGVMGFGVFRKDKIFTKSSMLPLAIAAGKVLLYDASAAVAPVRIACLLVTGAVLYASGLLLRKIDKWI